MKTAKALVVISLLLMIGAADGRADARLELGLNQSYHSNLLNDSTERHDFRDVLNASLKLYPTSALEIGLSGDATGYDHLDDLNGIVGRFGVTWIPDLGETPFSLYGTGTFSQQRYGENLESFDNNTGAATVSLGYHLSPALELRTGVKATAHAYVNSDSGAVDADNEQYELFAGLNASLPGSNSFDLEFGIGQTNYSFIDASVYPEIPLQDTTLPGGPPVPPNTILSDGDFRSFFVSPRLSRPLGRKTGVSLTYSYRRFSGLDDAVVLGYSTNFLSPWASFYEGSSIALRLKTYLISGLIVTGGAGYWDREYLRTVELETYMVELYPGYEIEDVRYGAPAEAPAREDELTRVYINVMIPFVVSHSSVLEQTFSLDYSHNSSTLDAYDYSGVTVSIGITYRR